MIILSHRGYWQNSLEKNTLLAFERSADKGFGVETDVRDYCGNLVVSHDPAEKGSMPFGVFLQTFNGSGLTIALNIKADGLAEKVRLAMAGYSGKWFAFDMSGPETLRYLAAGVPVFTRHSDIELTPICYEAAAGVWLDSFYGEWFSLEEIKRHIACGKRVSIVSPELHARPHEEFWKLLVNSDLHLTDDVMLCTDFPVEARQFFAQGG